ncbi:MAG TPA: hypothetical protein DCE44_12355, partial [Verrucomicrobiales bacterium]|nr:hypothetical protein [Verrucomicrobiales bacterium]
MSVLLSFHRSGIPLLGQLAVMLTLEVGRLWAAENRAPRWPPVPDAVYLQEIGRIVPWPGSLSTVAALDEEIFVGTAQGLLRLQSDGLARDSTLTQPIRRLKIVGKRLWAITPDALYRRDDNAWTKVGTNPFVDLAEHRGEIVAADSRKLWRVRGDQLEPLGEATARFDILEIIPHQESLYALGAGRLTTFASGAFGSRDVYDSHSDQAWDWGTLPSRNTRDALSLGNRLAIATDRGLAELRGMSLTTLSGEQGLPFEDITCLARGFTNDLWLGTTRGAIRQVGDEFHYFAGQRWLPDERVNGIAVVGQRVYIATDRGLGIIEYQPYTLAKKAAYYERWLEAWGQKRLGLVHKLEWDDELKEFVREAGDNDGGYTGYYLAAQSYRWAVTRDPAARREATNTFHALCWLETMTGIPGFPARSVWAKGERGHKSTGGSGGYPAEWHDTADGQFEWKGDTSSDELCSHFYAVAIFLELAAEGAEIARAKTHLARIAT